MSSQQSFFNLENLVYEYLTHLEYPEIREFCSSDLHIFSLCKQVPQIWSLIEKKRIKYKTDLFLSTCEPIHVLNRACMKGDVEIVNELIKRGYDPNLAPKLPGESDPIIYPLGYAAIFGHLPVVNRLLQDNRVDPTALSNNAIANASSNKKIEVIRRLLQDFRIRKSLSPKKLENYKNQVGGYIFPPPTGFH